MRTLTLIPSKRCATCHEVKMLEEFGRDRTKHDGRNCRCRACRRAGDRQDQRDCPLPPLPENACLKARDGCKHTRMPGDVLCADCRAYYDQSARPSGYGEDPEEERRANLALNRLAMEQA